MIDIQENILIIDDEKEIAHFLKDSLEMDGYRVVTALNGKDALDALNEDIHLILLDIMLPDIDGYKLCHEIRKQLQCPILFLSALNTEQSLIEGLMIGGDDYVVKPFSIGELKARIEAHLRRQSIIHDSPKHRHPILRFGKLRIDLRSSEIRIYDQKIPFTHKEFSIIKLLALNPGQVMSKEQILEKVWGYNTDSDCSTVVEHIKKIRAKVASYDPEHQYIETTWGVGYKWGVYK